MPDVESAKKKIAILVDKYNRIKTDNKISKYNEENTKAEFIEPLFEALGWDVRNTYHADEVTREERISKDRVDYSFRINGIPKFFLEAKALRENLDNPKFAEQAINYSWHKGCTWAVLTDFEAVKIFNAEIRTTESQSNVKSILCHEFLDRFDELWLLSKESFEQGLLDKQAQKWGKVTKKSPVDKQLLADFTHFREILSKNISKLNPTKKLSQVELDEATQRILDRLMFIRYCEDKELEEKRLISTGREAIGKSNGYLVRKIRQVYSYFDDSYNSKIFAKHLCDELEIDNEVLCEVIEGLYHTKDNSITYDFSAIEADVLGNIYEQYLGHILKKTAKTAKLTESQAHRKEQGIYYTPTHIVDYIVRNTLGKLLEDKKTNPEKIRVLDPACGSGSFLIKAFDILNEYHLKHDKDYAQTRLDVVIEDSVYTKKLRIVQDNIFGVDLDKQAVEVAQLNLLLKVTEKGKRLPLLQQNIKQGNSLIESSLDASDRAFNWHSEFPKIFSDGGFDIIVGNPPYFNIKSDSSYRKIDDHKLLSNGVVNISALFVKRSLDLLKPNGYLAFIIPKSFSYVDSWKPLRDYIYENAQLLQIIDMSRAFKDVLLEQVIIVIKKQKPDRKKTVKIISDIQQLAQSTTEISYGEVIKNNTIGFSSNVFETNLSSKMNENVVLLGSISSNFRGIGAQKFVGKATTNSKRILSGKEVQRYATTDYHNYHIREKDLSLFNKVEWLQQPKIMAQNIVAHIRDHIKITATYDEQGILNLDTVNNIVVNSSDFLPKYILALLNSKLISYYTYNFIYSKAIRTMHFDGSYSGKIPIKNVTKDVQLQFVQLVDKMLSLNKKLNDIGDKKTDERAAIEDEIQRVGNDIDNLVYKLYGLTEEEKKIIEESLT